MALLDSSFLYSELQSVCGFSCEDIAGIFKELRGLGAVVKQLSNELHKVVRSVGHMGCFLVTIHSLLSSPFCISLCFQLMRSQCIATCHCNGTHWPNS